MPPIVNSLYRQAAVSKENRGRDTNTYEVDRATIPVRFMVEKGEPSNTVSIYWRKDEKIVKLKSDFTIVNPQKTTDFLNQNQFLFALIEEGYCKIREIFGDEPQLFLELDISPEEDFEELFIIIKSKDTVKNMLALLEQLDEKWFLNILPKTKNKFNITVEPI